ncbi:hypothetical protein CBL_02954 [Carabus blaptoides fortunei]
MPIQRLIHNALRQSSERRHYEHCKEKVCVNLAVICVFDAPPPILNFDFLLNGSCRGIEQDFVALEQCKLLHYNCYCEMGPSTRNILFGEGKNYVGPILQGFHNVYQIECPISPFALQKCYRCRITLLEQMKQRDCMDCRYEFYSAANDEEDQLSVDLTEAEGCPVEAEEVVSTVSLLDLVELIWIPTLKAPTILIIEIVKFLIAKSVESQNLISKRLWTTVSETLIPFQKFLKAKKNHAITFSFEHWKQALNDADLYTTFSQFQIELTQRDLFLTYAKRVFTEEYLLSLSTSTTSTSSTTAGLHCRQMLLQGNINTRAKRCFRQHPTQRCHGRHRKISFHQFACTPHAFQKKQRDELLIQGETPAVLVFSVFQRLLEQKTPCCWL